MRTCVEGYIDSMDLVNPTLGNPGDGVDYCCRGQDSMRSYSRATIAAEVEGSTYALQRRKRITMVLPQTHCIQRSRHPALARRQPV